jgi:phosphoribosylformimino-5-aminoimidazole carboxamide ribotide isomerase
LEDISAAGLRIWLDAGAGEPARAESVADYASRTGTLAAIIIALESVADPAVLPSLLATAGAELAVFSLDLQGGTLLARGPAWRGLTPLAIAQIVVDAGFRRLIALDLAHIGVQEGPKIAPLCRALRQAHPHLELAAGGGVRGAEDLAILSAAGCAWALVASALHDGRLTLP